MLLVSSFDALSREFRRHPDVISLETVNDERIADSQLQLAFIGVEEKGIVWSEHSAVIRLENVSIPDLI